MTKTTFIVGLATFVWKIAQGLAYKPLAVVILGVILTYADLIVTTAISCYGMLRSLKTTVENWNIPARTYWYVSIYGPKIQDMYKDHYLTALWTLIGSYVVIQLCIDVLYPSLQRIRKRLQIEAQNQTLISGAERMVAGSVLEDKAIAPKFQAEIWTDVINDPTLYYRGVAFRSRDNLYTALHVLADCTKVVIKAPSGSVTVKPDAFCETGCDVTWVKLSDSQWGHLGMSSARLMNVSTGSGVWVKIVAMAKGTFGILKDHDAMGMCEYSGSTIKGFSGAPYYVGNCVYGMHVGSDPKNVGYTGSHIAMLTRALNRPVKCPEDSAEYLINQMNKFGMDDFEYEQSPFFGDEFAVSIGGVSHLVDFDTFSKMSQAVKARRRGARKTGYQYEDARTDVTSFLGKRHPQEARDVPLVPATIIQDAANLPPLKRGQLSFESSEIPLGQTADALYPRQDGPVMGHQPAPCRSGVNPPCRESEFRTQTTNSVSYTPESTHAQPRRASTIMSKPSPKPKAGPSKSKVKRAKVQAKIQNLNATLTEAMTLIRQMKESLGSQKPSEASKLGELISQVQQTETSGLTTSSISH